MMNSDSQSKHTFWNTMPVADFVNKDHPDGKLYDLPLDENPIPLPEQFEWVTLDPDNEEQMKETIKFLNDHYVSDGSGEFRLCYTKQFLSWFLKAPKRRNDCFILLMHKNLKVIVGTIIGSHPRVWLDKEKAHMCEISFLCLNKNLRKKNYAQRLIMEASRRSVLGGIDVALFASARRIYTPNSTTNYYHRPLQYRRLVKLGFCGSETPQSLRLKDKFYQVSGEASPYFRPIEEKDLVMAHQLLNQYLKRYTIHPEMDLEEFTHTFFPSNPDHRVIRTYVVVNPAKSEEIIDMISYYQLDSLVLSKPGDKVRTGYLYYYTNFNKKLVWMFDNLLKMAQMENRKLDVFNLTDLMENRELVNTNMFLAGTGTLHYYLYNWKMDQIDARQVGKLLI